MPVHYRHSIFNQCPRTRLQPIPLGKFLETYKMDPNKEVTVYINYSPNEIADLLAKLPPQQTMPPYRPIPDVITMPIGVAVGYDYISSTIFNNLLSSIALSNGHRPAGVWGEYLILGRSVQPGEHYWDCTITYKIGTRGGRFRLYVVDPETFFQGVDLFFSVIGVNYQTVYSATARDLVTGQVFNVNAPE